MEILTADEFLLTKTPFSAAVIFPLLIKSPCMVSILTPVPEVEEIAAPSSLFTTKRCAPVLMSSPFPLPEIFPIFATFETSIPLTDTAASFPEEVIVTSLLMTYSASVEKFWGVEVDWSIVLAKATAGGNNNRAGKRLPRVLVALLSLKCLLLIYTSI
ncbi:hypothetical protein [Enterobacter roggenkampii]|uniref:hypothetical protein n=1 Tax=Enterobacter roggenkampii TaxID=1812935 RepID=UPI0021BC1B0F|nr:hypothetical protein [Enterobacter roggenkampii]